jgi:hypothetical protein
MNKHGEEKFAILPVSAQSFVDTINFEHALWCALCNNNCLEKSFFLFPDGARSKLPVHSTTHFAPFSDFLLELNI